MLTGIIAVSIIVAIADLALAAFAFLKHDKIGRTLAATMVMAAAVDLTYTGSVVAGDNYETMSWFSSFYFSSAMFFDYRQRFVSCNEKAALLIPPEKQNEQYTLQYLIAHYSIEKHLPTVTEDAQFAWNAHLEGKTIPWHCSLRVIKDEKDRLTGYLFVCADSPLKTDLITGFRTKADFERDCSHSNQDYVSQDKPSFVLACDITGLAHINQSKGRHKPATTPCACLPNPWKSVSPRTLILPAWKTLPCWR